MVLFTKLFQVTQKLNHAKHNEDACNYLIEAGNFRDWVVTTAFYSALHYIEYELFPLQDGGNQYESFPLYYRNVLVPNAIKEELEINKHEALIGLVKDKLAHIYANYKWLHDSCMNARYNRYTVSRTISKKARISLSEIKKNLTKVD